MKWWLKLKSLLRVKVSKTSYRIDGWEKPLETEHFARDPQFPIEKLDQQFRNHSNGDPTL